MDPVIGMDCDGSQRTLIDPYESSWIPMNPYGSLLILMDPYWSLLIPIDDGKFYGSWLMPMFPNSSWWSKSVSLKSAWIRWWRKLCSAKDSLSWILFSFDLYSFSKMCYYVPLCIRFLGCSIETRLSCFGVTTHWSDLGYWVCWPKTYSYNMLFGPKKLWYKKIKTQRGQ